jgi:hypothetical protein
MRQAQTEHIESASLHPPKAGVEADIQRPPLGAAHLQRGVALIGKFDGEFAGHSQTYAGTGTLRVSW